LPTAAQMIARLDAAIAATGETVTLQRTAVSGTTGAVTVTEQITCPAHVRAYVPQDLVAGEVQGIRVIISATSLAQTSGSPAVAFGPPGRDDRILINGNPSNIEQIAPLYYDGALIRVNLLCRG
jgi:hypothetical protein